jgi:mannose-6-phosphate isomerase-like protein (cupin superfamily)
MTMYAADDIRSRLATSTPTRVVDAAGPIKASQWIEFHELDPSEIAPFGSRTWIARAANLVIVYTDAKAGDVFARTAQPDEYAVLMYSDSAPVTVTGGGRTESVSEEAFVVVPPGDSEIRVDGDGVLIRLFSSQARDLSQSAVNASAYAEPDARATPLRPWPDPVGGFALRVYRLVETPIVEGRFGRIFRTTNLMVNFLAEEPTPRDAHKLSPHHHDDFEQISLAVKGRFVHHIRYPWGPDSTRWRPDERREIATPSICVIPPPTVHTTQGIGSHQQLIDIFSPPRVDFAASGWVLNADDYPSTVTFGEPHA